MGEISHDLLKVLSISISIDFKEPLNAPPPLLPLCLVLLWSSSAMQVVPAIHSMGDTLLSQLLLGRLGEGLKSVCKSSYCKAARGQFGGEMLSRPVVLAVRTTRVKACATVQRLGLQLCSHDVRNRAWLCATL